MQTLKVIAAVAASPIILSAVVFASTSETSLTGKPAGAPNRAEVFAASDCGAGAYRVAETVKTWQDALAAKRLHDEVLVLAAVETGAHSGCDTAAR
ncbi:hypothetical protein [Rhodobacter calidifons]|uniref:Secreted protein n=1 Tax=Rhodobacter calidifons TaxID=2715277 RepID=A0ABX0G7W0_9RHOB|nr:hypothetical protein [Rhodobacter calidifons]NHB77319.1 hypothetical protein [Rhodobacter calidifons]